MIKTHIKLLALSLFVCSLTGCSDNGDQPTIKPNDVYLELDIVAPNKMQNIDPSKKSPTRAYEDKEAGELIKTLRSLSYDPTARLNITASTTLIPSKSKLSRRSSKW